ncbi:MAG: hypothetical protein HY216_00855 [Candidatus Rokubacteria bacterium]|nr:hypothetical protein [Candidatus Rokubacteria bacterium]
MIQLTHTGGMHPRFVLLALLSHTWWQLFYPVQEFVVDPMPGRVAVSVVLTLPLIALTWVPIGRRALLVALLLVVSAAPGVMVMEPSPWLGQARIVYLSSAFFAIIVALGFTEWWRSSGGARRMAAFVALGGTLLGYGALTALNARPWIESGRLSAELPGRMRALSGAPFDGPVQFWGAARDELDPTPGGITLSVLEQYYGGHTSYDPHGREAGDLSPIWVFPSAAPGGFSHDGGGALPDIRKARAPGAHVLLWSPTLQRLSDVTDAVRRRLDVPCDGQARESRTVLGAADTAVRWKGRTWGGVHQLHDDRLRWSPQACDRLLFGLRLRTLGRPHPFWNRILVSWRGVGAGAADPDLLVMPVTPLADGVVHRYEVPLGRNLRWLLPEQITRLTIELPQYPASVELLDARLVR